MSYDNNPLPHGSTILNGKPYMGYCGFCHDQPCSCEDEIQVPETKAGKYKGLNTSVDGRKID